MFRAKGIFAGVLAVLMLLGSGGSGVASAVYAGGSGRIPLQFRIGYHLAYASNFKGRELGAAWTRYEGQPGSDGGGWWDPSHVSLEKGMLVLSTFRDPSHYGHPDGEPWVEGGADLHLVPPLVNGEYFVRARVTSARGVTEVMLLWPDSDRWPPEIDFNESNGTNGSSATFTWGGQSDYRMKQATVPHVDLTKWHTWGVIVRQAKITYVLDGHVWATMTNREQVPMHLAIQQQVWKCGATRFEVCPDAATPPKVKMLVQWVVVYRPNA